MERKRVAIYCRVDKGGDPNTLQTILTNQKGLLEEYAASHDLQVVGCYQDPGYSGDDFSRPGLNEMAADYQAGRFDAVLVTKRSRLSLTNSGGDPGWPFPVISAAPLEAE